MNNLRRKELANVAAEIEAAQEALSRAQEVIEQAHSEEEEYYDCMPEGLQGGEKGEKAQEAVDALQGAIDAIEEIDFSEIEGYIETATE